MLSRRPRRRQGEVGIAEPVVDPDGLELPGDAGPEGAVEPARERPTALAPSRLPRRWAPDEPSQPAWYLVLAAILFTIGAVGLLVRRNVLVMFMCVELMLNAVNLTFVSFSRSLNDIGGQVVVFFVLVVAAAEVVVGLGIIVAIFRRKQRCDRRRRPRAEGLTGTP